VLVRGRLLWLRWIAALAGLAAFFGGVVALFTIDNSAGSVFLITLGTLLVLISLFGRLMQIESFEIMGAKIKVHEVVRSRFQLALARSDEEDGGGAVIREQALTLQELTRLYDLYAYVRSTQRASSERTAALDEIAARRSRAERWWRKASWAAGSSKRWQRTHSPKRLIQPRVRPGKRRP
jgi:hypothetical protein